MVKIEGKDVRILRLNQTKEETRISKQDELYSSWAMLTGSSIDMIVGARIKEHWRVIFL